MTGWTEDATSRVGIVATAGLFRDVLFSAVDKQGLDAEVLEMDGLDSFPPEAVLVLVLDVDPAPDVLDAFLSAAVTARPASRVLLLVDQPARLPDRTLERLGVAVASRMDSLESVLAAIKGLADGRNRPMVPEPREHNGQVSLTTREKEVLAMVAEGLSDEAVATRMEISVHTVRSHLQSVRTKLHVSSRFAAVSVARQSGVLHATPHGSLS